MTEFAMIIGGERVRSASEFDVTNPSTGELVGKAPNASAADLDRAVAAAALAYESWSKQSDADRSKACSDIAQKIGEHAEELAQLLTKEQGKPLNGLGSRFELGGAQVWAAHTASLSLSVKTLQDNEQGRIELHRKSMGVVGSITPWNWPVMIAVWHILPAVRTGNTVVIKPSPFTPLSTIRLVELMNEVLPAGVVNVVTSDDHLVSIGSAMSSHPEIRKIVFTGSINTGKKVMASAAETVKRLTLELGGNDAAIVLPDVDPAAIAEGLFWGAFINNGQTCAAMKRLYVHESVYDDVCRALTDYARNIPVGDGQDETSILGPIANQMQFDKVKRLVDAGKQRGRVLLGGEPGKGLFFPPTLIADLVADDPLVFEEQFGPALPIIKYSDLEDAIAQANDSPNGLGGSVWSKDIVKAKEVASRLECGSVWINKHGAIQPNAPFGGVKSSGCGVEFGEEGLAEYTDIQVVFN
ncbi:MAG: aldehyde dehydrogenase [Curvibacter sp. GWA2_64_110]|nr:MAG: aldehyde dehydrogenase [Curvibacter sp. GWA2_64_110]HCY16551.1 aldehyde dehydrogenase [Curvibacter sp.]